MWCLQACMITTWMTTGWVLQLPASRKVTKTDKQTNSNKTDPSKKH